MVRGATTTSSNCSCTTNPCADRSEEHTSELQSRGHLVCRLLLEKKKYQHARRCTQPHRACGTITTVTGTSPAEPPRATNSTETSSTTGAKEGRPSWCTTLRT